MRWVAALSFTAAMSLAGCFLNRSPLGADDGGSRSDGPGFDAARSDAAPPDTGPPCVMTSATEVLCDRVDDDCNGTIDDQDVCGCLAFTVAGRAFLSCPPVSGMDAWSGGCRRAAPGYDLAVFSSAMQQRDVLTALRSLGERTPHWIGLNDFDENGTYVWRDRSTTFTPTTIGFDDPEKRFVILRDDGSYEELAGTESYRILCEAVLAPGACRGVVESAVCDGIDDDCNGLVDDGIDCGGRTCTSRTFWDHVYYLCDDTRNQSEAQGDCTDDMGATLAILHNPTEHAFVAEQSPTEAWLGLAQEPGSSAPDAGWLWSDGSTGYGVPVIWGTRPWDGGEPNDGGSAVENNSENCGILLGAGRSSLLDDRACNANLRFICERTWSY